MPHRCAYGCKDTGNVMHSFPNPGKFPERFKAWVSLVGYNLETLTDHDIYKKKRICDIHFTDEHRNRCKRLNALAMPTLHLPGESHGITTTTGQSEADLSYSHPTTSTSLPSTTPDPQRVLHGFPNPEKDIARFRTWVHAIGGDILSLSNENIYKLRRVCHAHFEEKYCCRNNRISNVAVPTLLIEKSTQVSSEPGSYSAVIMKEDPLQITDSLETTDPLDITDPLEIKDPLLVTNALPVPEGISPTSPTMDVPLPEGPEVTISPTSSIVDHSPALSTEGQKALYTGSDVPAVLKHTYSKIKELPEKWNVAAPVPPALIPAPGSDAPAVLKRTYSKIKELPEKWNVAAPVPPALIPAPDGFISLSVYKEQQRQIKSLKTQIGALQKRCTSYKNRLAQALKPSVAFQKVTKHMTEPATLFTKMQFSQTHKKPGGRRFTSEEKYFSLALYKTSPEAYSFLAQWFTLPSIKMIRSMLVQEKQEPNLTLDKNSALPSNKTQVQEKLELYLTLDKSSALPSNRTQVQEKLEPYLTLDKSSALPANRTQVQEKQTKVIVQDISEPYLTLDKSSALPSNRTQVQEKLEPYLTLDKSSALTSNRTQVQEKLQPYLILDKNSALPSNRIQVQEKQTNVIVQDISEPYLTLDKNSPLPIKITLKDIMTRKQLNPYLSIKQNSSLTLEKTKETHAQEKPEPHHTLTKKSSVPSKKVLVVTQENLETYLTFNKNSKSYLGKRKATTEPE